MVYICSVQFLPVCASVASCHACVKGMAVLMRVGQQDRTVHPYYGRRMYRVLHEWDVNVTYVELPGKEHWWWDTVYVPKYHTADLDVVLSTQ